MTTDNHSTTSRTAARNTPERRTKIMRTFLQGRIFTLNFFISHLLWIVLAIVMVLTYIGNKYECQTRLQETITLQAKLLNAKTDCVEAGANYNSMIRESRMQQYLDTMHVNLTAPEQPPYTLTTN